MLLQEVKSIFNENYRPAEYNIGDGTATLLKVNTLSIHIYTLYIDLMNGPYSGKGIRHWIKSIENKRKSD